MFQIYGMGLYEEDEPAFETEREAIDYVFSTLPSDDVPYLICDEATGLFTAFVFQRDVWRPVE